MLNLLLLIIIISAHVVPFSGQHDVECVVEGKAQEDVLQGTAGTLQILAVQEVLSILM